MVRLHDAVRQALANQPAQRIDHQVVTLKLMLGMMCGHRGGGVGG